MRIIWIIIGTIISGILYRLGGSAKRGDWTDILRNTKTRDLGCPLIGLLCVAFVLKVQAPWYIHTVSFLLTFGALTTYWDKVFGYDNFFAHGLCVALGYALYGCVVGTGAGIALRIIIISLFMGVWCKVFKNDVIEEVGRGGIIVATLPLLLI